MNNDELVELIAEKVLRIIGERKSASRCGSQGKKKRLLIMMGRSGSMSADVAWRLSEEYDCIWQNRGEAYANEMTACDFDLLFVAELSNGQLASAALGVPYGAEARPIIEALCAGRPLFIMEEGILFRKNRCASQELGKLYEEYLRRLWSFGAKPVSGAKFPCFDYSEEAYAGGRHSGASPADKAAVTSRVLTEREVKELAKDGSAITISQKTIITPLARDFIIHEGIKIIRA